MGVAQGVWFELWQDVERGRVEIMEGRVGGGETIQLHCEGVRVGRVGSVPVERWKGEGVRSGRGETGEIEVWGREGEGGLVLADS